VGTNAILETQPTATLLGNPSEVLVIQTQNDASPINVRVYTYAGQLMYQNVHQDRTISIAASTDWAAGVYYITIEDNTSRQTLKWMR
jgi:hypothetical protein